MRENEIRTGPEEREGAIEVVLVDIGQDGVVLRADLLVRAQDNDKEPEGNFSFQNLAL